MMFRCRKMYAYGKTYGPGYRCWRADLSEVAQDQQVVAAMQLYLYSCFQPSSAVCSSSTIPAFKDRGRKDSSLNGREPRRQR